MFKHDTLFHINTTAKENQTQNAYSLFLSRLGYVSPVLSHWVFLPNPLRSAYFQGLGLFHLVPAKTGLFFPIQVFFPSWNSWPPLLITPEKCMLLSPSSN